MPVILPGRRIRTKVIISLKVLPHTTGKIYDHETVGIHPTDGYVWCATSFVSKVLC